MTSHHILARADALMSRKRPPADNEDVPILTDVVDGEISTEMTAEHAQMESATHAQQTSKALPDIEQLRIELLRRIEQHLHETLPGLIDATLQDMLNPETDQLPPAES